MEGLLFCFYFPHIFISLLIFLWAKRSSRFLVLIMKKLNTLFFTWNMMYLDYYKDIFRKNTSSKLKNIIQKRSKNIMWKDLKSSFLPRQKNLLFSILVHPSRNSLQVCTFISKGLCICKYLRLSLVQKTGIWKRTLPVQSYFWLLWKIQDRIIQTGLMLCTDPVSSKQYAETHTLIFIDKIKDCVFISLHVTT